MNALPSATDAGLLRRMTDEYVEMPGLRLTCQQAQRLWMLDASRCVALLNTLIDWQFLVRGPDGQYARRRVEGDERTWTD